MLKYGSDHVTNMKEHTPIINTSKSENNIEDITTKVIGEFGRWQLYISVLMALMKLPIAWYQLNILFMAPPQDFWCEKPVIFSKYSDKEWRKICAPKIEEHPCLIFDPDILILSPSMDKTLIPLTPCKKFVYDFSVFNRTITSDWNLVCSNHWLIHFTQCIMMWGIVTGGIVFGVLADKFGRRKPLMICIILQGVASYIASVIWWYWIFIVVWFILALASGGIGIISFVVCMETISGKWRTIIPILYQMPFGLGSAIMAGLAFWLRDWRKLEIALATLSSLYILYWFWIPESPRWLLVTGRTEEAYEVLKEAARKNKVRFHESEVKGLLLNKQDKTQKYRDPGFMSFIKSKNMRKKTLLLSLNWFFTGLAFYSFSQYLGEIAGNIFLTVAVIGIISTPGSIMCLWIVTKYGRKTTVGIFQIATVLCFVFILIIPKNVFANDWPRLFFAGIGFATMAGSVPALYLLTGELYPTLGRNIGISGVTTFARIASIVAPVIINLNNLMVDLPLIILSITSFVQIFLLLPLPETKDCPLPDTLEQAENFVYCGN